MEYNSDEVLSGLSQRAGSAIDGSGDSWRIQMRAVSVGGIGPLEYAHSYIAIVNPEGRSVLEFHGYNQDPVTGQPKSGGGDPGDLLQVAIKSGPWDKFSQQIVGEKDLAVGDFKSLVPKIAELVDGANAINEQKLPYHGWGFWEAGQNCNSVSHTLSGLIGAETDPASISPLIATGSARSIPIGNHRDSIDMSSLGAIQLTPMTFLPEQYLSLDERPPLTMPRPPVIKHRI